MGRGTEITQSPASSTSSRRAARRAWWTSVLTRPELLRRLRAEPERRALGRRRRGRRVPLRTTEALPRSMTSPRRAGVACLDFAEGSLFACTPGLTQQSALVQWNDGKQAFDDVVALANVGQMVTCATRRSGRRLHVRRRVGFRVATRRHRADSLRRRTPGSRDAGATPVLERSPKASGGCSVSGSQLDASSEPSRRSSSSPNAYVIGLVVAGARAGLRRRRSSSLKPCDTLGMVRSRTSSRRSGARLSTQMRPPCASTMPSLGWPTRSPAPLRSARFASPESVEQVRWRFFRRDTRARVSPTPEQHVTRCARRADGDPAPFGGELDRVPYQILEQLNEPVSGRPRCRECHLSGRVSARRTPSDSQEPLRGNGRP